MLQEKKVWNLLVAPGISAVMWKCHVTTLSQLRTGNGGRVRLIGRLLNEKVALP